MTDQLLPIVPGCRALSTFKKTCEVVCVKEIEEYLFTDRYGRESTLTSPNAKMWLLDRPVYSGRYIDGTINYIPITTETYLFRIDGHKKAEKQESEEAVK